MGVHQPPETVGVVALYKVGHLVGYYVFHTLDGLFRQLDIEEYHSLGGGATAPT